MFNSSLIENAAPAGFGVLELIATPESPYAESGHDVIERPPRATWRDPHVGYAALERTELLGTITGPLAALRLVQRFRVPARLADRTLEARYRFPLPGDAAVTGVVVRFGDVEVATALKARPEARTDYDAARAAGHQAALLERESPDVYSLRVSGLQGTEAVEVETRYVLRARLAGGRWSARFPLTTVPRFVRQDESGLPQADANPLAVVRDPGHRFALDVSVAGGAVTPLAVTSPTHALRAEAMGDGRVRVRLEAGEVLPDRDCVLQWRADAAERPALELSTEDAPDGAHRYVLALVRPPMRTPADGGLPRDLTLLVDRSGSMEGAKWDATRWAIRRLLAGLASHDRLRLAVFDMQLIWFAGATSPTPAMRAELERFLDDNGPRGGTELGTALEEALRRRAELTAPSTRHCLVLTDGQVTDRGRILEVVARERARSDARRVSVLCIDSAPNASLATELAESGGGSAHFLSSNPGDGDVASALEEVLEGFAPPLAVDLAIAIDRPDVESAVGGATHAGGAATIVLGDLVTSRPSWAVLRLPRAHASGATVRVRGTGLDELALPLPAPAAVADGAVRAAFGAQRIALLERLSTAGLAVGPLSDRLRALGYDPAAVLGSQTSGAVYAANAVTGAAEDLRALLVRESLASGVPSTATAFVAVRAVAGHLVDETVVVPSALAAGWSGEFTSLMQADASRVLSAPYVASAGDGFPTVRRRARARPRADEGDAYPALPSAPLADALDLPAMASPAMPPARAMRAFHMASQGDDTREYTLFDGWPHGTVGDAAPTEVVLFEGHVTPDGERLPIVLKRLHATAAYGGVALPPGTTLLLHVGDLAVPAVSVDLALLLAAGGDRPLHIACPPGTRVRLVLALPSGGRWPSSGGRIVVTLRG
jgi:Ca-activated chloride channel family protein